MLGRNGPVVNFRGVSPEAGRESMVGKICERGMDVSYGGDVHCEAVYVVARRVRVGRGSAGARLQPAEVHGEGREQADGAAAVWNQPPALAQRRSS